MKNKSIFQSFKKPVLKEWDFFVIINDYTALSSFYLTKNAHQMFLILTIFILYEVYSESKYHLAVKEIE
jgi:hypothetical protein